MPTELLCPKHGPFDASLGVCPICSGGTARPAQPRPLEEDDMKTDPGFGVQGAANAQAPRYPSGEPMDEDNVETQIPGGRRKGAPRFLDEDEEATQIGRFAREDVTEIEGEISTATAILWVKEGKRRGQIYRITKPRQEIGRDAELVLDDEKASHRHAAITIEEGQFVIWDMASRNGTYVNGEKIRSATPLKENDTIKIGGTIFVLKILE
jgi:hypothetical protein